MKSKITGLIKKSLKKFGILIVSVKKPDGVAVYKNFYSDESIESKRFYNVCAGGHICFGGGFNHPLWRNLDVMNPQKGWGDSYDANKDFIYDMLSMDKLPIETNSAEIIQCQYSIEHVPDKAAEFFFEEVMRALKPGGIFKIVTPNAALDYLAYTNNDISYYSWIDYHSTEEMINNQGYKFPLNKVSFEQVVLAHFAASASENHIGNNSKRISDAEFKEIMSSMDMEQALEYCSSKCDPEVQKNFRYNHMNWWTHDKVMKFLKNAKFTKNYSLAPGQSSAPIMRNSATFDNLWNYVALFIEARKN